MNRKKIIVGFSGGRFDKKEIDFISKFLPHSNMLYVGAVINDLEGVAQVLPCQREGCKGGGQACIEKKERKARQELYRCLAESCKEAGCRHLIHNEDGCMPVELIEETCFADLLILSRQTYNARLKSTSETEAVPFRELLESSQCPVLVLPEPDAEIEQVVITFDGSAAAMHDIRQFSFLLSESGSQLPVSILTTYGQDTAPSPEEKLFTEFLKKQFGRLSFQSLKSSKPTACSTLSLDAGTLLLVSNPSQQNLPVLDGLLLHENDRKALLNFLTHVG